MGVGKALGLLRPHSSLLNLGLVLHPALHSLIFHLSSLIFI